MTESGAGPNAALLQHLLVDFTGGANPDHIEDIVNQLLGGDEPQRNAFVYASAVLHLTAANIRTRSNIQPGGEGAWGLEVQPVGDVDVDDLPDTTQRLMTCTQALTAALNEDGATVAALLMGPCKASVEDAVGVFFAACTIYANIAAQVGHPDPSLLERPGTRRATPAPRDAFGRRADPGDAWAGLADGSGRD